LSLQQHQQHQVNPSKNKKHKTEQQLTKQKHYINKELRLQQQYHILIFCSNYIIQANNHYLSTQETRFTIRAKITRFSVEQFLPQMLSTAKTSWDWLVV